MSKITRENAPMSSEADVSFMEFACGRIAEAKAPGQSMKVKIGAVLSALRTRNWEPTENRVYEFIKAKARRVEGFEKDRAREVIQAIEAEHERAKNAEHLRWLESQIAGLRESTSDQEHRQPHIDAVEHFLRRARSTVGALEVHERADIEND